MLLLTTRSRSSSSPIGGRTTSLTATLSRPWMRAALQPLIARSASSRRVCSSRRSRGRRGSSRSVTTSTSGRAHRARGRRGSRWTTTTSASAGIASMAACTTVRSSRPACSILLRKVLAPIALLPIPASQAKTTVRTRCVGRSRAPPCRGRHRDGAGEDALTLGLHRARPLGVASRSASVALVGRRGAAGDLQDRRGDQEADDRRHQHAGDDADVVPRRGEGR